jgi:hypothetical protein
MLRALASRMQETATVAVNPEYQRCAESPAHFVNNYCYTYDPRVTPATMRFRLFPKQAEYLTWLQNLERSQESGVCEKSRGVGISFLSCAYALHGFLFRSGFKAGFGSRKLHYVDRQGDMDSLFEKIRFMLRKLPEWMLPKGFKFGVHDCYAKLLNPANGAAITGEGGDEIGRGGRTTIYFVDESAHLQHPEMIDSALTETTNVRVDVSTPNGNGNPFYLKRATYPSHRIFTFHWKDDPRKDEAWARKKRADEGETLFASQYDIDYAASLDGIAIPAAWVKAAMGVKLHPSAKCIAGQDVAEDGNDLSVFVPRRGPVVGDPVSWSRVNTTETAWRARDEAEKLNAAVLCYDSVGVGAGVKGTLNTSERKLRFTPMAINVGKAPSETVWPDGETSQEKFDNLKAELWWSLRCRFERTYEHFMGVKQHPNDEMISLPQHQQLAHELSIPKYFRSDRGKIRIESKKELKARGIKSPDFADALVLSEAYYVMRSNEAWVR